MSIFEFAMKMEQDGEKFYRELAGKTQNAGLKQIFTYLADEEVKHYRLFKGILERQAMDYDSSDVLEHSKSIFTEMKASGAVDVSADTPQVDGYRFALEMEKKAYTFFEEKCTEATDPKEKKFLEVIAKEERRHYHLIESIIEFVSQPEEWVENAEFNNLTEY
jgi:rubrerythrin